MKHLDDVGLTYEQHFQMAFINAIGLLLSGVVLLIHAFVPCWFTHTASSIVKDITRAIPRKGSRILVRFNTKWEQDSAKRQWRVLLEGVESLAHQVHIQIPCKTIMEPVDGCEKFHFECFGKTKWDGTEVFIVN